MIFVLFGCKVRGKHEVVVQGFPFQDSLHTTFDNSMFFKSIYDTLDGEPIIVVYDLSKVDSAYLVNESLNLNFKRLPIRDMQFPIIDTFLQQESDSGFYDYQESTNYCFRLRIINISKRTFIYVQSGPIQC
jgi:hypothetical protein